MREPNLEKLLGGYATGTLTDAERKALLEAALEDQALFNALSDEQALKDLLDDPASRRRILATLDKASAPSTAGVAGWRAPILAWLKRPANLGLAGSLATAVLAVLVVTNLPQESRVDEQSEFSPTLRQELEQAKSSPPEVQREEDAVRVKNEGAKGNVGSYRTAADKKAKKASPSFAEEAVVADERVSSVTNLGQQPLEPPEPISPSARLQVAKVAPGAHPQAGKEGARVERLRGLRRELAQRESARALFYARAAGPTVERKPAREKPGGQISPRDSQALRAPVHEDVSSEVEAFGEAAGLVASGQPVSRPLGLRYSVLKREPGGDFQEIDPEGPIWPDDELRLTVEANVEGYLYVLRESPTGEVSVLFPTHLVGRGASSTGRVVARRRAVIPERGTLKAREVAPPHQVILVFSREPLAEMEALRAETRKEPKRRFASGQLSSLLARVRSGAESQRLIVEKVGPQGPTPALEIATYVVDPAPSQASSVMVEIELPTK